MNDRTIADLMNEDTIIQAFLESEKMKFEDAMKRPGQLIGFLEDDYISYHDKNVEEKYSIYAAITPLQKLDSGFYEVDTVRTGIILVKKTPKQPRKIIATLLKGGSEEQHIIPDRKDLVEVKLDEWMQQGIIKKAYYAYSVVRALHVPYEVER